MNESFEERTRYSRISAGILDELSTTASLDEYIRQAAILITNRFGFSLTRIFLYNEIGNKNILKSAFSPKSENIPGMGESLPLNSTTLLGWVSENKQFRASSLHGEEGTSITPDLILNCQSEIGIPILSKNRLLGVLDAESDALDAFDNNEIIISLQALSTQLGSFILGSSGSSVKQGGLQEITDVYQTGYKLVTARDDNEIVQIIFSNVSEIRWREIYHPIDEQIPA
jgi:hypothetical protein